MSTSTDRIEWLDQPVQGERVRYLNHTYGGGGSGVYHGVVASEWDGEPIHFFTDGEVNGAPQRCHGIPAAPGAEVTNERTPSEIVAGLERRLPFEVVCSLTGDRAQAADADAALVAAAQLARDHQDALGTQGALKAARDTLYVTEHGTYAGILTQFARLGWTNAAKATS